MDAAAIFNQANGGTDPAQLSDTLLAQAATSMANSGNVKIPTFGGVSLSAAQQELARTKESRENLRVVSEKSQAQLEAAANASKRAADATALADGDEAKANQARAQDEADNYSYFNKLFGINQGGRIAEQAAQLASAQDEAAQRLKDIKEKQSTGIFDNPLEWIYNQVTLPDEINVYNRTAQQIDMGVDNMTHEISLASASGLANAKGIPAITTAQAKAKVDQAAAMAEGAKAKIDTQMAKENVDFANKRLAADLSVLSSTEQMTQMQMANATAAYHSQITAIQLSQSIDDRKLRAAELLDKLAERKAIDPVLARYDEMMGNQPGTTTRATFNAKPKALQAEITAVGAGSMGANAFDAYVTIRNVNNGLGPNATPAVQAMYKFIGDQFVTIQNDPGIKGEPDMKKKQELISAKINAQVLAEVAKAGQPTSIFHELSPQAMIGAGIINSDSAIGKILTPMSQGPTAPSTENIGYAFLQAAGGDINVAGQALADYYKKNIQMRNQTMSAKSFGIALPETYQIRSAGAFGQNLYDLTNPASATKWLLKANIADVAQQLALANETDTEKANRPAGALGRSIIPAYHGLNNQPRGQAGQ